jgi:uncharacterized protein (TIGR02444 family)
LSIWDWTLAAYARPGAAEACLDLQDRHGQNVPLLLWAVWAGATDPGLLERAAATARGWDAAAVGPLRAVRRALKSPSPPVEDAAREALRAEVKTAELRAERVLLETLETLSADRRDGGAPFEAVKAASAAWGPPAPDDALAVLARALS